MNITEDFFFNGYTTFSLKDSPVKERFLDLIKKNFHGRQNILVQKILERVFLIMIRVL